MEPLSVKNQKPKLLHGNQLWLNMEPDTVWFMNLTVQITRKGDRLSKACPFFYVLWLLA